MGYLAIVSTSQRPAIPSTTDIIRVVCCRREVSGDQICHLDGIVENCVEVRGEYALYRGGQPGNSMAQLLWFIA